MVTLTESATKRLEEMLAAEPEAKGKSLRIGMKETGCSGYEYVFSFDDKKEGDSEVVAGNVRVLIGPDSAKYFPNSTLDYTEDGTSAGFKIQNPNEKGSCGCGSSKSF